jgi:Na+-transporting NADH:ubiquinone oxidoreductase subunit F
VGLRGRNLAPVFQAYSLANPPMEANRLRFTIRIATPPPGTGSTYIFNLKPGDKVTLSGPFGEFAVKDTGREMCFVGGGAGMAPLRSQILARLLGITTDRRLSFWYGARSKLELFFDEEFKALAEKFPNFSYHVAQSNPVPEDQWEGMTGFIHQRLYDTYLATHKDPTEIEYYLCGPPMMVQAVEEMVDSLGVEPEMIAYNKFS